MSLYPQKLALTSSISGGRLAGTVRSRTQATEFSFSFFVVVVVVRVVVAVAVAEAAAAAFMAEVTCFQSHVKKKYRKPRSSLAA
jgi:hypothetical protein